MIRRWRTLSKAQPFLTLSFPEWSEECMGITELSPAVHVTLRLLLLFSEGGFKPHVRRFPIDRALHSDVTQSSADRRQTHHGGWQQRVRLLNRSLAHWTQSTTPAAVRLESTVCCYRLHQLSVSPVGQVHSRRCENDQVYLRSCA